MWAQGHLEGHVVHQVSMCLAPRFLSSCASKDQLKWKIEKMEVRSGGNTHMIFQSFPFTVVARRVQNANQIDSTPFPKLSVALWCPQQKIHTLASVYQAPSPTLPQLPVGHFLTYNSSRAPELPAGTSLVVQWLKLHLPNAGVQVLSLIRELWSHMSLGQKTKI